MNKTISKKERLPVISWLPNQKRQCQKLLNTDAHSNKNYAILEGSSSRTNSQLLSNTTAHPFITPLIFRGTDETELLQLSRKRSNAITWASQWEGDESSIGGHLPSRGMESINAWHFLSPLHFHTDLSHWPQCPSATFSSLLPAPLCHSLQEIWTLIKRCQIATDALEQISPWIYILRISYYQPWTLLIPGEYN